VPDRTPSGDTTSTAERRALMRAATVAARAAAAQGPASAEDLSATAARQRLALVAPHLVGLSADRDRPAPKPAVPPRSATPPKAVAPPRPEVPPRSVAPPVKAVPSLSTSQAESATERLLLPSIFTDDLEATAIDPAPAGPPDDADCTAERLRLSLVAFEEQEKARAAVSKPKPPAANAAGAAASGANVSPARTPTPPAAAAADDVSATSERRRLARIVHDDRGTAHVEWVEAPPGHQRVTLSIEEPLELEKGHRSYNPYESQRRGQIPAEAAPPRKRDLRKLSDWMKQVRELDERKKRGEKD
jgi:hypothetical protein